MDRWRHGYVVNLYETQRTSKLNINPLKINVNDIVLVFYEKVPRHFWRIAIVTRVLPSRDSEIRGAIVRIAKTNTILKHPVKKLFALENTCHDTKDVKLSKILDDTNQRTTNLLILLYLVHFIKSMTYSFDIHFFIHSLVYELRGS